MWANIWKPHFEYAFTNESEYPSPFTFMQRQRPDRQSRCNASIAKLNRFLFAGTNKIQRSSSGARNSLQKLVFQKTRSKKSRFKQKPIFSITKNEWAGMSLIVWVWAWVYVWVCVKDRFIESDQFRKPAFIGELCFSRFSFWGGGGKRARLQTWMQCGKENLYKN